MHLDFVSNMLIVLVSFLFRQLGLLEEKHIPGLRAAAFNFALPALMLNILWQMNITAEIMLVLVASATTYTLMTALAFAASRLCHPQNRGLYAMAGTGHALPFVYAALMNSDRFGIESVPVAIMWDVGGNMWVNIIYYAIVGDSYSPASAETEKLSTPEAVVPNAASTSSRARSRTSSFSSKRVAPSADTMGAASLGTEVEEDPELPVAMCAVDPAQVIAVLPTSTPTSPQWKRIATLLFRNIALWAVALGLLLNLAKVPYFALPGRSLNVLGSSFAPLLYSLVGANLRFDLGLASYGVVFRILLTRWVVCLLMVGFVRTVPWGFDARMQGVITLCISCPLPSMFVMYTGLFGYRTDQAVMIFNVTAIISLLTISFLTPVA
jgi:predicted permease